MPGCLGRAGQNIFYENRKIYFSRNIFSWLYLTIFFETLARRLKIPTEEDGVFHHVVRWAINIYLFR